MSRAKDIKVLAADGRSLAATVYSPLLISEPTAGLIINSATAVERSFYQHIASYLADQGFLVVSYDYRGVGDSKIYPVKSDTAKLSEWGDLDTACMIDWMLTQVPQKKVGLIAHSLGGTVVGLAKNNTKLTALVDIGTPHCYWKNWQGLSRLRRGFDWQIMAPLVLSTFGYIPKAVSGFDLPGGCAKEWIRWCSSPKFVVDERGEPMQSTFANITAPFRFYSFTDDEIAPPSLVAQLMELYPNAQKEHQMISPEDWQVEKLGHFDYFRQGAPQAGWTDLSDWLKLKLNTSD